MELWIRSQDKENLIKTSDIYLKDNVTYKTEKQRFMRTDNTGKYYETLEDVEIIDKFICCEVWGNRTLLGTYKTKERALEVLNEIQKIFEPQKIIKNIDNAVQIENLVYKINPTYEVIQTSGIIVYEMPKE